MKALPILMNAAAARAYLGGADPAKLVPPLRIGGRVFYSREALDRAVRKAAGLPEAGGRGDGEKGTAYDDWKEAAAWLERA